MTSRELVSCIIPTGNRTPFLARALEYWKRQTFAERELIVVDDTPDAPLADSVEAIPRAEYIHVDPTLLGTKLNIGIEAARGDIIQKWDDDDIYRPRFLEIAVDVIRGCPPGEGFVLWDCHLVYTVWDRRLYFSGHGHKAGPTLCFDRDIWQRTPFRDLPRSVDSWFIADHDESFVPICAPHEFVMVRHGANTWQEYWQTHVDTHISETLPPAQVAFDSLVEPEDLAFYNSLAKTSRSYSVRPANADEEHFVAQLLLEYFQTTYRELGFEPNMSPDELPEELRGEIDKPFATFADPLGVYLVVREKSHASPAGGAGVKRLDATTMELSRLFVRPAHRGRGLGRELTQAAIAHAQVAGARRVVLDVLPKRDRAIEMYRELGFRERDPYKKDEFPMKYMELVF